MGHEFRAVKRQWDSILITDGDAKFIKGVFSVFVYDASETTHLCELTPSYDLRYCYTTVELNGEHTPLISDDEIDTMCKEYEYPCDDDMDIYLHCTDADKLPNVALEVDDLDGAIDDAMANRPW